MKKLLFACVCAATVAAFADPLNKVGFEGFTAGTTGIGEKNDNGQGGDNDIFFMYEAANSSTDGSTVKAYGVDENLPAFNYNGQFGVPAAFTDKTLAQNNYLELSTEGGTLWRSATQTSITDGVRGLGLGYNMATDYPTLYVDTMVQFTPTEDGEPPTTSGQDKIAIWLNVDATTDEEHPVTNLCILARGFVKGSFDLTEAITFEVNNVDVKPGEWYRLTVQAIGATFGTMGYPGYLVYLDGTLLTTKTPTMDPEDVDLYSGFLTIGENGAEKMKNGSVFISLLGTADDQTFKGVGFKGSGAIDDFQIDTATPNFIGAVTTLDFTLAWGEGISAVSYTVNGGAATVATSGTKVEVEANSAIAVTVTYAPWYVAGEGPASFTVTEPDTAHNYTAVLAATPEAAGAGTAFGELETAKVKAWADAKSLTPAEIADCEYAMDAYLLNTGLDDAPALAITAIEETEGGWNITVKATAGDATVSLNGINGVLKVKTAATLGALAEAEAAAYTATFDADGVATIKVTGDNTNFMKATVVAKTVDAQ